ncbi:transporter substrate-binding domain-containing protein [Streptococcus suis]|nr:transporter substrate-binding domain-containing protein [Streptococcus suis]
MTKKKWAITGGVAFAVIAATIIGRQLIGKSESASNTTSSSTSNEVITLKVAHTQSYAPYDFINEKGESDGFEVAVLKAIDEKLDTYQFEYVGTSDEDLLIGLESGKYDIGTKGAWYTAERAEKFIIPENAIGASIIGFTIRKEDSSKYTDIDSFAAAGGKLVPISPQNAQYNVIQEYNKDSSTPIKLEEAESFKVADAYAWVLEGRYDAFFDIKLSFEKAVTNEDGAYHQYADKLTWFPYKGIETYPLIHKSSTNEEFAKAYDEAIQELKEDGTISKLSTEYFGEDVFSYVTK